MNLHELLSDHQASIAERWFERTAGTYSKEASRAYVRQKNQFANPVGHTLRQGTAAIVPLLIDADDPEALRSHLEPIIKMRTIQEFSPAQAVGFVYLLKDTIREELAGELAGSGLERELSHFEARIDRMALLAFDIYVQCRELVHEIRIREIKRRISRRWERVYPDSDDPRQESSNDST
jgi:hypothetical protein